MTVLPASGPAPPSLLPGSGQGSTAAQGGDLAGLRDAWRRWMGERLPAAARARPDWPIRLDHCFGRVILDEVYGRPWREVLARPPGATWTPPRCNGR